MGTSTETGLKVDVNVVVSTTTEPSAAVDETCETITEGAGVTRESVSETGAGVEVENKVDVDADEVGELDGPTALLEHEA